MDLDWVLGVVADGPTKTFAFRRLKYLTSKWNMYSLLNENQELADMKVCFDRLACSARRLFSWKRACHIGQLRSGNEESHI